MSTRSSNLTTDPFRDLFSEKELSSLFEDDEQPKPGQGLRDWQVQTCPGCAGQGRYIGLFEIEDPCLECGGTGTVRRRRRDTERPQMGGSAARRQS